MESENSVDLCLCKNIHCTFLFCWLVGGGVFFFLLMGNVVFLCFYMHGTKIYNLKVDAGYEWTDVKTGPIKRFSQDI